MKKIVLFFILSLSVTSIFASPPGDWMYLVTGQQFGLLTKTTTYKEMIDLFGKDKLKDETQSGPEGEGEIKCTIIYKGTDLEMTVYWEEKKWHKKIHGVACTKKDSPYHTNEGLKIGSSLNALVKVNKAYISFSGFGWDYGGAINDYHNGALQKSKVYFTLDWNGKKDETLLGDGEFTSKMPKVTQRAKDIYIAKMIIYFLD